MENKLDLKIVDLLQLLQPFIVLKYQNKNTLIIFKPYLLELINQTQEVRLKRYNIVIGIGHIFIKL